MIPEDILDPRSPLRAEITTLRALCTPDDPTANVSRTVSLNPTLRLLYQLYLDEHVEKEAHVGAPFSWELVSSLLLHLEQLIAKTPSPDELSAAPLLDDWCAALIDPSPRLLGRATGHPRLRDGARTYTSPYLRLEPEAGWARTYSRYYRLGKYDRRFLGELIVDEVVSLGSQLIDL